MTLLRIFAALALAASFAGNARADDRDLLNVLHMLDYIGVDYAGAVQNGAVISAPEFREQQEFASEVTQTLRLLKADPALEQLAATLERQIAERSPAEEVQRTTRDLARRLLAVYPVATAPKVAPKVADAAALYRQNCASCHGAIGGGDGPAGAGLAPPPADFLDAERHGQRSLFALYNTLNTGVAGTGMPSFAHLPEDQRWALAFYVGQLIYNDAQRREGERLWKDKSEAASAVSNLEVLADLEPAPFSRRFGASADAVLAYLRTHPEVLEGQSDPLTIASTRLKQSLDAYRARRFDDASQSAISAYLDGFELIEAQLATADPTLMQRVEEAMMGYRTLIRARAPVTEVEAAHNSIAGLLAEARARLSGGAQSAAGSFVGSFVILAREGLEAILVLAAMFAFLRKTDRTDALPYLHAGWIAALVLGGATWAASNWTVAISGAGREMTEGFTGLLAAVILLSVGLWLHNKSYSNRWQQYVAGKMRGALSGGRPWGIALLAFVAVYREVFETVLFYRALWSQGDHLAIVLGLAAAAAVLVAVTWAVFALSIRLPIREFFRWSSALIVLLAVVFTGKGIAALQEAGVLSADAVQFVRIPLLGIYPNAQGLLLQGSVLLVVFAGLAWNHLRGRSQPAQP